MVMQFTIDLFNKTMVKYTICRMGTIEVDVPSQADPTTHCDIPFYLGDGIGWTSLKAKNFTVSSIEFKIKPPYNIYDQSYPDRFIRVGLEPATVDGVIDFESLDVQSRVSAFNKLPFQASSTTSTEFSKVMVNAVSGMTRTFPVIKINVDNGKMVGRENAPENLSSSDILNYNTALYQIAVLHIMATYESLKPMTTAKDNPFDVISRSSPDTFEATLESARKRQQQRQNPNPTSKNKYQFLFELKYNLDYIPADERTK